MGATHPTLRTFLDGQLLISAQTPAAGANALYGATALDLARQGVFHVQGGVGQIAETLAVALQRHGGTIVYRQEVQQIEMEHGRAAVSSTHLTPPTSDPVEISVVAASLKKKTKKERKKKKKKSETEQAEKRKR